MDTRSRSMKTAAVCIIALLAACSTLYVFSDIGSADAAYTVTDGAGNEFTFESTPEHIATIGVGVTATAIQIGALDKIVVCDKYSKSYDYEVFEDLHTAISNGEIRANGSAYSSGHDSVVADVVYAADNGNFDKNKDIVILTGSFTTLENLITKLKDAGIKNILIWQDVKDYSALISFVSSVSVAINGKETEYVSKMTYLSDYIAEKLEGVTKAKGIYTTYSSGDYKVGNTGSLANSMILAAGGESVSIDADKSSTYGDKNTLAKFITNNPGIIVFMDNSVASNSNYVSEIESMSTGVTKVALDPLWNNYSIASMDGVWTMACALYPDIFEGDVPEVESKNNDNLVLYAGAAIAAVAIIGIVAFVMMRK